MNDARFKERYGKLNAAQKKAVDAIDGPVMVIAGTMVQKKRVIAGPGTFPTDGIVFGALLAGVIIIVGLLTFFPAFALGPIVDHLKMRDGLLS